MIVSMLAVERLPVLRRIVVVGINIGGFTFTLDLSDGEWRRLRADFRRAVPPAPAVQKETENV